PGLPPHAADPMRPHTDPLRPATWTALCLAVLVATAGAQTFTDPTFSVKRQWTATSLGLPSKPGGMLFSADGINLYVISTPDASQHHGLYRVNVTRGGATNEVTNLTGPAVQIFGGPPPTPGLDSGLELGPAGTLFYTYWGFNDVGDILNILV